MYIVILEDHSGYFGPFASRDDGVRYIAAGSDEGRVVALIRPWVVYWRS